MVQTLITCPYIEEYIHDPDYIDSPNDRDDSVLLFESTESDVMESIYASQNETNDTTTDTSVPSTFKFHRALRE